MSENLVAKIPQWTLFVVVSFSTLTDKPIHSSTWCRIVFPLSHFWPQPSPYVEKVPERTWIKCLFSSCFDESSADTVPPSVRQHARWFVHALVTRPAIQSFPLIINSILRSEFIVYCPAALGPPFGDTGNGVKRVVGDLLIVSRPRSGVATPDTWLHEFLEFHSTVRSHRRAQGEVLKVGSLIILKQSCAFWCCICSFSFYSFFFKHSIISKWLDRVSN